MKIKNNSRRKFLNDSKNLALTTGMMYGLDSLFSVLLNKSIAQASSDYEYRFINFVTSGGPPRWFFDQPLNPFNRAADFIPGNFGTQIQKSGSEWKAVHVGKSVKIGSKNFFLPPVWSLKQGGTGPAFSELLKEVLMIRGLNMEINSHNVNRERTVRPVNSEPSISGLVGQYAQKPISSIGHAGANTSMAFKSADGSASVDVPRNNPTTTITSPFAVKEIVKYDDMDYSMHQALDAINNYAKEQGLTSQGNEAVLKNCYDMFASKLDAFAKDYEVLLKKYQDIVNKEIAADFPGVTTDLNSIKPDGSPQYQYVSGKTFASGDNLKNILATATPPQVAAAFAFAEFALKENLTSSLTLEVGLNFSNIKGVNISNDQHFIGAISSVIFTNLYYRSILGCMTELRKALVGLKIWDKTVIQMASEFSRTPTTVGRGSDHGFESGSTSIFSGMIKTPELIGNIYITPPATMAAAYAGTWGHAAPYLKDSQTGKNRAIINDDVVRTVCEMLQIPKIGTKGASLVKNSSGSVTVPNPKTSNVKRA